MQLTCDECHTTYRLNPRLLGDKGRVVRCAQCNNTWRQKPLSPDEIENDPDAELLPLPDDNIFMVEDVQSPEPPVSDEWNIDDTTPEEPEEPITFKPLVKGQFLTEDGIEIPQAVRPGAEVFAAGARPEFTVPIMTHRPFGMEAAQFGVATFLLLTFATLGIVFAAKHPIVRAAPVMGAFYQALGFTVTAPGEGLTLADMTAENRIDGIEHSLVLNAKLANISDRDIIYPAMGIEVRGAYGAVLRSWDFKPDADKKVGAGETIPVTLQFDDAPDDGKTVALSVTDR